MTRLPLVFDTNARQHPATPFSANTLFLFKPPSKSFVAFIFVKKTTYKISAREIQSFFENCV